MALSTPIRHLDFRLKNDNKLKIDFLKYPKTIKILLAIYVLGFAIGTTTHVIDLLNHGLILNKDVPTWKNLYWASLTFLDFLTIILILRRSIVPALIASNLIIISDVLINTNGFTFERLGNSDDYKIFLQIIFGLYILTSTPIILRLCAKDKKATGIQHQV